MTLINENGKITNYASAYCKKCNGTGFYTTSVIKGDKVKCVMKTCDCVQVVEKESK